jgi:hypothetical protein
MDFGKVSISIQEKILARIFGQHSKNDQAGTIDGMVSHANLGLSQLLVKPGR